MPLPEHAHDIPRHVTDQLERHENELKSLRDSSTRLISEQGADIRWMRDHLEKLAGVIDKIDARQDRMEGELSKHNNFQGRLRTLEDVNKEMSSEYIPRVEVNAALLSIREHVKERFDSLAARFALLTWAMGAGLGICFTALGFLIFGG
jgi:DNA repair exonuclease SbcCD ATPase subunit